MIEVCPWNEVFGIYKRAENETFVILYWYLFNKPDYQSSIVKEMKKLKESFKNLPKGILDERNIGKYLHEMEEYNLIGRSSIDELKRYNLIEGKIDKKRKYFQTLSFFYIDPFCIKTPNSRKKDIKAHYEEYKEYIKDPKTAKYPYSHRTNFSFKFPRSESLVSAQEFLQGCSSRSEKFMKVLLQKKKIDYITLYELIIKTFIELEEVCDLVLEERLEDAGEKFPLDEPLSYVYKTPCILDGNKAIEKCKSYQHSTSNEEDILEEKRMDIRHTREEIENLLKLYIKIERQTLSFNKETWRFE